MYTQFGQIELLHPEVYMIKEIQRILPYGFYPFNQTINGYNFGFVIKCDSDEMKCLKQQPVEVNEDVAHKMILLHHILILKAYLQIKDQIGDSIYYATPYLKNKGNSGYESGIAHFIFPEKVKGKEGNGCYDFIFGSGATNLFQMFVTKFQTLNKEMGLDLSYIGVDVRTRAQLGALVSGFMIYKGSIIYHGAKVEDRDPRFAILAKAGVKRVIHMSSTPMEIRQEQLAFSKGEQ